VIDPGGGAWSAGLAGAALAALPFDLREEGMLGDAGANALGAVVGTLVLAGPMWLVWAAAGSSWCPPAGLRAGLVLAGDRGQPGAAGADRSAAEAPDPGDGAWGPRTARTWEASRTRRGGLPIRATLASRRAPQIGRVARGSTRSPHGPKGGQATLAKHIFVTGGVASSLGKGLTAARSDA
jgi:hypothetical protein